MILSKNKLFHLLSPIMASVYSLALYLIFIFIPPSIYTSYVEEPDLMFMDLISMAYVFICTVSFIVGAICLALLPTIKFSIVNIKRKVISKQIFFSLPLLVLMLITVYFSFIMIVDNASILHFILLGEGNVIKDSLILPLMLSPFYYVFIGTFFWFYYNYLRIEKTLYFKLLVWVSILMVFIVSTIMVARYLLMPFLLSTTLIYLFSLRKIKFFFVFKILFFIVFLFSIFALMRGGDAIESIMGYGPASYNRLSAVLSGDIQFEYQWYYLSTYFDGHPNNLEVLNSEHIAIGNAGLDLYLNWISVYGYIFVVFGWFAFIYFFLLGLFMQYVWNSFYEVRMFGQVTYPWFFTLILLWFSSNMFSWATTIIFILTALLLSIYESIFRPSDV